VRVASAAQAAARDRAAIDDGIPSRALMQRAGAAAAGEIARRYGDRLARGVAVFAGPGNNGGDAWVVAGALAAAGVDVRVTCVGEPRTPDARAERELARSLVEEGAPGGGEGVVVDGLLGTGSSGPPRGPIADAAAAIESLRRSGAAVVALDVPTGIDATTGAGERGVRAELTVTFGTMKRGLLVARGACGTLVVVDIGLGAHATIDDGAPELLSARWVADRVPAIRADSHKGTRRRVVIVGGGPGMAGAAVLAARAAVRSGVGMVRVLVAPPSLPVVQTAAYDALAGAWPESDEALDELVGRWADAVLLGPGLGRTPQSRELVERVLGRWSGPVVLDADALNVFEGRGDDLASLVGDRPALLTPHVTEFARLAGGTAQDALDRRFDAGGELARRVGATVLLKGVPTVVTDPTGRSVVSAVGTPVLAAAGSGDLLAGIAATLLAQLGDPLAAGGCAAWVHGRAAEIANAGRSVRGITLDDVARALPEAWRLHDVPNVYPVLAELPAVGEER
jgi:NAD(P)H-hydrate epimerase